MAALSDLTPRELQILQLVLIGRTNKTIAAENSISGKQLRPTETTLIHRLAFGALAVCFSI